MIKERIIHAMQYSGAAYDGTNTCSYGVRSALIERGGAAVCYIGISPPYLKIIFKGSDSREDWRQDLRFWKRTIPYGNNSSKIRVHSGFISAYKSKEVRGQIHKYVTEDICRIQLTGHSLGAALAVLCAVDLQYNFPSKDYEVVLFGCPRVGNIAFARSYNRRVFNTIRVVNKNDFVTKLPPSLIGYRHVGARFKIGNVGSFGSGSPHSAQSYYSNLLNRLL